ncbi:PIN domain nuclease of toxin-antitoxin system [Rhizobium sp. PP-F2F-G48]|uniref:type II toxin-antitoxin system VapC family toxin n=1 Tax=Rhizobium sp. PP-F2F-G48 TaxID=2135651 RepID=UPI001052CFD3|nr:type II toxin-antitoxin system VapC family toxin [Rhizobium sp. PP-F2F-G48]TCM51116.1 PIN domain nuclease of toxin-antitoxin system [Rhizobium sp. PP-F2F-G48]
MACVLDASAVLCLLFSEKGSEKVEARLGDASMSVVNYTEVLSKLIDRGLGAIEAVQDLSDLDITIVPVGQDVAEEAARLRSVSKEVGLSLGDRFCLALAKKLGASALTSDRTWKEIAKAAGVKVEVVR